MSLRKRVTEAILASRTLKFVRVGSGTLPKRLSAAGWRYNGWAEAIELDAITDGT